MLGQDSYGRKVTYHNKGGKDGMPGYNHFASMGVQNFDLIVFLVFRFLSIKRVLTFSNFINIF